MPYIVYIGPRQRGATIVNHYARIEDLKENDGSRLETENILCYTKKLQLPHSIGAIFEVKFPEPNTVSYTKKTFPIDRWTNEDDLSQWKAFEIGCQELKDHKNRLRESVMIRNLKPIKEAYQQSTVQGKRQILAEVIRIITT